MLGARAGFTLQVLRKGAAQELSAAIPGAEAFSVVIGVLTNQEKTREGS